MNKIPRSVKKYGKVTFGRECIVGEYTIIGYPWVESVKSFDRIKKSSIGKKCIIGSHVTIYEGVKIGDNVFIEDNCRIGAEVNIGDNCKILYGANINYKTVIGSNCIIAGFCCERVTIGSNVRLFGELIHAHRKPHLGWDDEEEPSPNIADSVCIGFGSKIIGGVKIGSNSYIVAGAIVSRDVPKQHVVAGKDKIIHYSKWKGSLKDSDFFRTKNG